MYISHHDDTRSYMERSTQKRYGKQGKIGFLHSLSSLKCNANDSVLLQILNGKNKKLKQKQKQNKIGPISDSQIQLTWNYIFRIENNVYLTNKQEHFSIILPTQHSYILY